MQPREEEIVCPFSWILSNSFEIWTDCPGVLSLTMLPNESNFLTEEKKIKEF